jgi:hypothetical protein
MKKTSKKWLDCQLQQMAKTRTRNLEIYKLVLQGKTFGEISKLFNISRQRGHQIFKNMEVHYDRYKI